MTAADKVRGRAIMDVLRKYPGMTIEGIIDTPDLGYREATVYRIMEMLTADEYVCRFRRGWRVAVGRPWHDPKAPPARPWTIARHEDGIVQHLRFRTEDEAKSYYKEHTL